ncbi:MAG: hypothetical protein RLZZ535_806 [Cyanobacteriota bacterium]
MKFLLPICEAYPLGVPVGANGRSPLLPTTYMRSGISNYARQVL